MVKYVSGVWALNLPSPTDTTGDWHASSLPWDQMPFYESDQFPFGMWGIVLESPVRIPEHEGQRLNVATHPRAVVDLIATGDLLQAQGMRDDYIGNGEYTPDIFQHVLMLRDQPHWNEIDAFMLHEYGLAWYNTTRPEAHLTPWYARVS
ncbi:MAG: hypothetical protein SPI12_01495 [Actinomycetaceae bacterium]|nr:hypothetical protein [Actinomycetaceae bacterium]MDY6082521.1 hypothetical protein [Actinomycetaceae bacterium]